MPAAVDAGVVNRPTTISPAVNPPFWLVSTRGAAVDGAPHAMSMTCVFENPAQLIGPPGGGVVPPPVPDCETVTDLEPPSPLTVYV